MDKIKTVKIKNPDGSVSEETYTISVDAKDVDMKNGKDLQDTIGDINVDRDGSIAKQLGKYKDYDSDIETLYADVDNLKGKDTDLENDIIDLQVNKINKTDIIDNLNSSSNTKVLSAKQGKVLGDAVTALEAESIKKKAYFFNTVADMKAANLKNNDCVFTLGYYSANDGGAAEYKIVDSTENYKETLNNNLYAELIIKDKINVRQLGLSPILTDNSDLFNQCIRLSARVKKEIYIPGGKYTFAQNFEIPVGITISGIQGNPFNIDIGTVLEYNGTGSFLTLNHYSNLKNLLIKGNENCIGIDSGSALIENITIINSNIGFQLGVNKNAPTALLMNCYTYNCNLGYKIDGYHIDGEVERYSIDTTLLKCKAYNCLNGYYINDYAIHLISVYCENCKSNGIPIELGENAKNCTIINSYLENNNVTKEIIINANAKYNEIKGFRYLGWISKVENNGDGTNIIICPSITNQTVQFEHGKKSYDYLGITAKNDYSSIYGFEKTSDSNITEGVRYGAANIFKNYDTKLIHKFDNFTARNRTNATISNPSLTQTITPQSINVPSKGYQNISFNSTYFNTTENTKFIAMALTNLDLVINFYKNNNYLIMHLYNPTDNQITSDPIPVCVLCWEQ